MSALAHIAAIRARILTDPNIVAIVGDRVYLAHVFDVREPTYPCITLSQTDGLRAVWAPNLRDPAQVMVECFSKKSLEEANDLNDLIVPLLHNEKNRTSTATVSFHEIRMNFENSGFWDADTNCWRQTSRYLVRVTT